ncbi:recombinase family protein [Candidatus Soleaferrea massiliensis]|uniref:recombinase family protein n=1 Tax=Candidatus Soleaferrea massiliensis TaxID=1470354 RepID=UPI0005915061|nr:recombinase family protein [Candidatus Soleaferrea massiliensis]
MRSITKLEPSAPQIPARKCVAAYARVSSGKDAMLHSLSAQISYYSAMIQKRRDWEYVGVYADEALTGTKDERPEFQRLMNDCRNGLIDMVITKSIARFARNTVTMLEAVRELKLLGVDVYFEKENIHSISGDGEVMLTILASYAQEESRSVSENCKWRIRKRFKNGELVSLRFIFGYRIVKGDVKVYEKEAAIVRMIFDDYIGGMGGSKIAQKLRAMDIPALRGGTWDSERVVAIVKNEKYAGNALLQKKYVTDHLTKKEVWNKGVLPMYFAEGTHPAIIDADTFEKAQAIMEQRRQRFRTKSDTPNRYPFSGKILCVNCGKNYKRKTANDNFYWNCSTYLQEGKATCPAKQIPEDTLYTVTAEVLGIQVFDAEIFAERVSEIQVPENNRLLFIFRDGRRVEKIWQDKSRRDSWDDAMRQAAREQQIENLKRRNRE